MHFSPIRPSTYFTLWMTILVAGLLVAQSSLASDLNLSEENCRSCHGKTMADRHHQMVEPRGYECFKCHQIEKDLDAQSHHAVATRNCLLCHVGSLADRHHLKVNRSTLDCTTCHRLQRESGDEFYQVGFAWSDPVPGGKPPGAIRGKITDENSMPVAGVALSTNTGGYETTSGVDGAYSLDPVSEAAYYLRVTKPGFVDQTWPLRVIAEQTTTLDIQLTAIPASCLDGSAPDACPLSPEVCTDVIDNDGDGFNDCNDSDCSGNAVCQPQAEICFDIIDNDNDTLSDCSDPDCFLSSSCQTPAEICFDTADNDGDGLVDCDDDDCAFNAVCQFQAEICSDILDNDGDGLLDCNDSDCIGIAPCLQQTEICSDGIDNDNNGVIDCDDPGCSADSQCTISSLAEICDGDAGDDPDGDCSVAVTHGNSDGAINNENSAQANGSGGGGSVSVLFALFLLLYTMINFRLPNQRTVNKPRINADC